MFFAVEDNVSGESIVARGRRAIESLERLEQARSQWTAAEEQLRRARAVASLNLENAGYTAAAIAEATHDGSTGTADLPPLVTLESLADRYITDLFDWDLTDAERAEIAVDAVEALSAVAASAAESAGDDLRFRLRLATDVILAVDALKDRLEQTRLQTAGELHFAYGVGKSDIGKLMSLTGTRVAQLLDDFYEEQFHAEDNAGPERDEDSWVNDLPTLTTREQAILAGCVLHLMTRDLATTKDRHRVSLQRVREDYERLVGVMAREADVTMDDEVQLKASLRTVTDTCHALAMLVELCASQPWASVKRPLDPSVRKQTLAWIAEAFGANVLDSDVLEIDNDLKKRRRTSSSLGPARWAVPLTLAAVAAVTGGAMFLAAPATGGAVGSMLGLSGAAARSAGLAALVGRSITAGGLGMAGGTAVLAGTGSLARTGLGFMGLVPRERVTQELDKLYALVRRLRSPDPNSPDRLGRCDTAAAACVNSVQEQLDALNLKQQLHVLNLKDQTQVGGAKTREDQLLERRLKQLGERIEELETWLEQVDADGSIRAMASEHPSAR